MVWRHARQSDITKACIALLLNHFAFNIIFGSLRSRLSELKKYIRGGYKHKGVNPETILIQWVYLDFIHDLTHLGLEASIKYIVFLK